MVICETPDFTFPMLADVYYPIVELGAGYGVVTKNWVLDKTIACQFNSAGTANKEEIKPEAKLLQDTVLIGRVKSDIRFSTEDQKNSLTNILITNIRDKNGNLVYMETSGSRSGQSTLFEIATFDPFVGPFGNVEFYRVILKRSDNQAGDL
jgi:GH15 family glucan-1,4-alpha-glucosidase